MAAVAGIVASEKTGSVVFAATGEWLVATAAGLDERLKQLDLPEGRRVSFDLAAVDRLDTTGAWLVLRTEEDLIARGNEVEIANLQATFAPLIDQVRQSRHGAAAPHRRPAHHTLLGFVARIGEVTFELVARERSMVNFFGRVCVTVADLLVHPRRLRLVPLVAQMEQTGVNSLPIVGLLSFLIGVVIAYQGADQLRRFGAEIYTVDLLGVGVLRELAVLMTSIIIAGRSGSAFTAQIGTMQVNEEIDALRTLGLDPVEVLVVPRLLALLVTLPMLTLFADVAGLLGGCLMAWAVLGITLAEFLRELHQAIGVWTLWIGIIKAPFFAAIVALVGCHEGFQVSRSAESVGRLTTLSVVESIFLIIVLDAGFSILFSVLNI